MKTGMNLLLWTTHVTAEHFPLFAKLKQIGYDGVEIPIFEGDAAHYGKIAAELKKQGLGCTTVTVVGPDANPISPDAKIRQAALDRHKWAIEMTATLGGEYLCGPYHSPLAVFSGTGPTEDEKQRAADVLRQSAEVAKQANVKLAIEYLNRFECYFLTTAAQARDLVRRVNHPNFKSMYDTFHANIEEKNITQTIKSFADSFVHVHISENDRGTPGTGHVHWDETFRALHEVKYDGWLVIEAFGRALPDLAAATRVWRDLFPRPEEVYEQGYRFMKQKWEQHKQARKRNPGIDMTTAYLSADRLFDGTGTASIVRPTLKIVDGRVDSVERGLLPPTTCSGERRDFPGCTIVPGFIDTHVHLILSGLFTREQIITLATTETDEQLLARALQNARAALACGITTVRDCGGKNGVVQKARDAIRSGSAVGADVVACGAPITTTTGHCHWLGLIANTHAEVQHAAERMLNEGADFLKIMATGGNMTASSDPMKAQYEPSALKLVADIGRKAGKHAAAHVLSRSALPGVVAANYRTIEHCDWRVEEFRYEFEPELARRIIDQQQYAGLTMSGLTRRAIVPEARNHPSPAIKRLDIRFACERQMLDFGVNYTLHTDAGVMLTPIDTFALGMRAAVVELRLTPAEVLGAVTRTAAEALLLSDRGTLVPGKRADLVVVQGNPLQDLANLQNVKAVMKAGQWFS